MSNPKTIIIKGKEVVIKRKKPNQRKSTFRMTLPYIEPIVRQRLTIAYAKGLPLERAAQASGLDTAIFRQLDKIVKDVKSKKEDINKYPKFIKDFYMGLYNELKVEKSRRHLNALNNISELATGNVTYVDKVIDYKYKKDENGKVVNDDDGFPVKIPIGTRETHVQGRKAYQAQVWELDNIHGYKETEGGQGNLNQIEGIKGIMGIVVVPAKMGSEEWEAFAIEQQENLIKQKMKDLGG